MPRSTIRSSMCSQAPATLRPDPTGAAGAYAGRIWPSAVRRGPATTPDDAAAANARADGPDARLARWAPPARPVPPGSLSCGLASRALCRGHGLAERRRRLDGRRIAFCGHRRERHPAQSGQLHLRPHRQVPGGEVGHAWGRVRAAAEVADGQTGLEAHCPGQDCERRRILLGAPIVGLVQQLDDLVVTAADRRPPRRMAARTVRG